MSENDFLWGVATSAFQSEGGYDGPGQPQTNWAGAQRRGDVMTTGRAADFWTRYLEDFAACRAMGLTSFRLGIEWTRLQPNGPESWDSAALDHYVEMLRACREHGLEPIVTLHHFVHPAWLGADAWLSPETPRIFERFVQRAIGELNEKIEPIHWWLTVNEPNMLVINTYLGNQFPAGVGPGFVRMTDAYNHLLVAHILAYNAIHDLYAARGWRTPRVTVNNCANDMYWSDKFLLDLLATRERGIARHEVRDHVHAQADTMRAELARADLGVRRDASTYIGGLVRSFGEKLGYQRFATAAHAPVLDALDASPRASVMDYIAFDYYDPFAAHAFRLPVLWDHELKNKSPRAWMMNTVTSKWWDWRVLPRGLHFFCDYYSRDFGGRDILIAENGMALRRRPDNRHTPRRDRITRSRFLEMHLAEVQRIRDENIPLIGYLHWSLFDNYEWGSFTPRFGLFSLDYAHGTERHIADPLGDRPSETYARLIAASRAARPH